jgi:hypothetical protein
MTKIIHLIEILKLYMYHCAAENHVDMTYSLGLELRAGSLIQTP